MFNVDLCLTASNLGQVSGFHILQIEKQIVLVSEIFACTMNHSSDI